MVRPGSRALFVIRTVLVAAGIAFACLSNAGGTGAPGATPVGELRELLNRGQYADAERQARAALETLARSGGAKSLNAAELLDVLVVALWRGGKASQADAVTFAERAIDIKKRLLGDRDPALATSFDNAGVLFFVRGDYGRARPLYERALNIWEAAAANDARHRADVGKAHSHLGPLFQELGQYSTARHHYEQSLTIFLETLGPDDAQIAMARNNLATLMTKIGDYDEALKQYRESLSSLKKRLGREHPLIANSWHNLAELNQRIGRDSEAIELYRQSLALKEETLGATHPSLALTLGNLSYLYSDRRETDAALPLAKRALEIQEAAYGTGHVELAYSLISLGRAQAEGGDIEAARRTLTRAAELRSKTLGADNPLLAPPLHFLSEALLKGGKRNEAFELALRAEAIAREHLRLTARGAPERQALRYAAERLSSIDVVLSIAANLRDPAISRAGWDALIRSRAVVLDEMAARRRLAAGQAGPALLAAFDDYRTAAERLSNVLLRGPVKDDIDQYRHAVAGLRVRKEAAERVLAAQSETVRRGLAQQRIGYDQVRAALPHGATLVAFARISRDRRSTAPAAEYAAFVLDDATRSPRIVSLGSARDIETAIRRWRDALDWDAPAADPLRYRPVGERMRELIWDPLGIGAGGDRLVLIVPTGAIHLVNFAALPLPDGSFLAESDVLIHYLSSERDLIVGDERTGHRQLLVVGGAGMGAASGRSASRPARASNDGRQTSTGSCEVLSNADFRPLPGSLREARRIATVWKATEGSAKRSVVELLEESATEAAFKRHARGKSVVHLAAHGFFAANDCLTDHADTPSPLRLSGLVLSAGTGESGDGAEDGVLLAQEVATLDFSQAQWVVLSGCDTGVGLIQIDEGILGLRRAFRIAGAGTLVMSLWPVEDRSAEAFMSSLYLARLNGRQSTVASMRQAYRDALATTERVHGHGHPLYWAPFIASGDWR